MIIPFVAILMCAVLGTCGALLMKLADVCRIDPVTPFGFFLIVIGVCLSFAAAFGVAALAFP